MSTDPLTGTESQEGYVQVGQLAKLPAFLPQIADSSLLEHVWVQVLDMNSDPGTVNAQTRVLIDREIVLGLPGLDAVALTVAAEDGGTVIPLDIQVYPELLVRISDVPLALRLKSDLFRPVRPVGTPASGQPPQFEIDPDTDHVDIELARVSLAINGDGGLAVDVQGGINLPPCMLGESNIVIEAQGITLHLDGDAPPAGRPIGWKGIHLASASLYLPGELAGLIGNLSLTDCSIGNGGFSGTVTDTWTPPLGASLFGVDFTLKSVSLTFVQNSLTTGSIVGTMTLPFFDAPVDIEICPNMNGPFLVRLASANGLVTLEKPDVLRLKVESLGFAVDAGTLTATMSGSLTPLVAGLDWPEFAVRELAIDSNGHVRLDGGWLDLPNQYALDFHGFTLEITKLGFGNSDDGGRWIGFSGGLKLVDGLSAGASVEGLRVTWYGDGRPIDVTLDGVGVELLIPDTLQLKGTVAYRELTVGTETVHRFDGRIKLDLLSLNFSVDATLVVGTADGPQGRYTFLAIYLDVELPAGIPLWSTGIALYGMSGLFAMNFEPDKHPDEEWYGLGPTEGWYHRGTVGVTDLAGKWVNRRGSLAFGAGVTLGTLSDNGFTFSGRMLMVIVFPGPIVLIEGRGNILKERSKLTEEPLFRSLTVLDNRAGTMLFGLDAQYKYGGSGELIEIHAGVEAFFSFSDPHAWHLYIGKKDPKEQRVRARIFELFEADSYFMLDDRQVAMGAWVGYDKTWKFGPLRVVVEAWLEGNAAVSRKPVHLSGDLWLHGKAQLSVWGFGLGLTVDARFQAEVFDPYHLLAEFSVGINLPWPLPDFDADITIEWGPDPQDPPLPLPLQEISVEHFKVTESWPLPRGGASPLLLPNFDVDGDGFRSSPVPSVAVQEAQPAPAHTPVVPLDARPHITFGRSVHDAALVGVNALPVMPEFERIGDPAQNQGPVSAKYLLTEIALHKWTPAGWALTARKATTPNPPAVEPIFGSWAPIPAMPDGNGENVGQVKLWLWSKSAFDYTRHSGRSWEDWFTADFDGYPCPPPLQDRTVCIDFERIDPAVDVTPPLVLPHAPELRLLWISPAVHHVRLLPAAMHGKTHAFCFEQPPDSHNEGFALLAIQLTAPATQVRIIVLDEGGGLAALAYDASSTLLGTFAPVGDVITTTGAPVSQVVLQSRQPFCVLQICATFTPTQAEIDAHEEMVAHLQEETARWTQKGAVLEPYTTYRLTVGTRIETTDAPIGDFDHVEFAYFRTEGPPGLVEPSAPIGTNGEFVSALRDLSRYVRQTIPPTVPAAQEPPRMPRPVYRAYDVGAEFNEDYVDLIYRSSRRDLGLYLFDNNNQPARDAEGRLMVMTNRWGVAETLSLTESETRWISTINTSTCAVIDSTAIPHAVTLMSGDASQLLDGDTVYEARLIPLLLHETFDTYPLNTVIAGPAGVLDGWAVLDEGSAQGPSRWEIREEGTPPARHLIQTTNIWGGTVDSADPVKPGSLLLRADNPALPQDHADQPGNWTDYRFSAYLRSADDDAIGLVFRYRDQGNYYRFAFDRERRYRRLLLVAGGVTTVLAEDRFVYQPNQDYLITIEAIEVSLRVYQDRALVFSVDNASHVQGRIGLYCWANEGARFSDITVDDYRSAAPVPYRFQFTTSDFVNVFHYLHSYQDETWAATLPGSADMAALAAEAVVPTQGALPPASEAESRAFSALVEQLSGQDGLASPDRIRVTRVEREEAALGFLVEGPEPIDWYRTTMIVSHAARAITQPKVPGVVKLTDVAFAEASNGQFPAVNDESVTVLLRNSMTPSGWTIEQRRIPGPLTVPDEGVLLFREDFGSAEAPQRFEAWTILDAGPDAGPSAWAVALGSLVQSSSIGGGDALEAPGTYAIAPVTVDDCRLELRFRSDTNAAIGVALRLHDKDNYYRFSVGAVPAFRRLIKRVNGVVTVLWQDTSGAVTGTPMRWTFDLIGTTIAGYLDGAQVFRIHDDALASGSIALYASDNSGAKFDHIDVRRTSLQAYALFEDRFAANDLSAWTIVDEGSTSGPSVWAIDAGTLAQTSELFSPPIDRDTLDKPGALALAGDVTWDNYIFTARVISTDDDAVGIVFRHVDATHFYRFSMDSQRGYRRLVKNVGGTFTLLWEDGTSYEPGREYTLTFALQGTTLRGYVDDVPMFIVEDADMRAGRIGLYTWGNAAARFAEVGAYSAERIPERYLLDDPLYTEIARRWTVFDDGDVGGPSAWGVSDGWMRQTSAIGDGRTAEIIDVSGTMAVAGGREWADYRFSLQLCSDADDAIGVMFRYQDSNNYYRFAMDRTRSYRRLIRKFEGQATVLWADDVQYQSSRAYLATFDCVGDRLTGYLDGVPLFDLEDKALPAGRIALYASGNTGARFNEVRVTASSWHVYHQFATERVLAAGTRVRVHSGNEAQAPPATGEAALERRFRASLIDRGRAQLPRGAAHLRLVPPQPVSGHERAVLSGSSFAEAPFRVLRKADGTAFALLPAGGSIAPGQYRLRIVYARDNSARDPLDQILSQAGDRQPEVTTLDIPWAHRG